MEYALFTPALRRKVAAFAAAALLLSQVPTNLSLFSVPSALGHGTHSAPTCASSTATIWVMHTGGDAVIVGGPMNGLPFDGILIGSSGNDVIYGTSGADYIDGKEGNDKICGDSGNDILNGGDGEDTINGGNSNDRIFGGNDDDILNGESSPDIIYGGEGDDEIDGGSDSGGDDECNGGPGNDDFDDCEDDDAAVIVITKDAQPNSAQDFDFDAPSAMGGDFFLDDDTDATLPNSWMVAVESGDSGNGDDYVIEEESVSGWTLSAINCSGSADFDVDLGDRDVEISLNDGEEGYCTFVNTQVVVNVCGDGNVAGGEVCDDGNTVGGDYCAADCSAITTVCGDNTVAGAEVCDDGNTVGGDYCSADCSMVTTVCGDNTVAGAEACDDGNTVGGDYCAADCSAITTVCGDNTVAGAEVCDDGNTAGGDYCAADCSAVTTVCGDSVVAGAETCDDGNVASADGCSSVCATESGFSCIGAPSACTTTCGDNITAGAETCDDGGTTPGDGCDASCQLELCAATDTDLEFYIQFDEISGTTAADSSGNGIDGTHINSPTISTDTPVELPYSHGSLSFDGIDDYVDLGNASFTTPSAFSVSAWVKADTVGIDRQIVSKGYNGTQTEWEMKTTTADGKVSFQTYNAGQFGVESALQLSAGVWTHLVGTFDGTTWSIYYNGTLNNSNVAAAPIATNQVIEIGAVDNQGSPVQFWDGNIDDVRFYGRALTASEVAGLYGGSCDVAPVICGDNVVDSPEACDDGNTVGGDYCAADCSAVTTVCGDSVIAGAETCDDGNAAAGDGCSDVCAVEADYSCSGTPSVCVPMCAGQPATVYVNSSNVIVGGPDDGDTYTGTLNGTLFSPDVIVGTSGDDSINGFGGGDVVCGRDGNDDIEGDSGNDDLYGENGNDAIRGGLANDDLFGGPGIDHCIGGLGSNTFTDCENTAPLAGTIVVVKDVLPTEDVQDFEFTLERAILPDVVFSLDDDSIDGTLPNSAYYYSGIGSRDVTETALPGWTVTSIVCDDPSAVVSLGTNTVTVDLQLAEVVTCTFTNEFSSICGNGAVEGAETCDDSNTTPGDGCSDVCAVEPGYSCTGTPSVCTPIVITACTSTDFDLVAHWQFEEGAGATAADSTTYDNGGALTGGSAFAANSGSPALLYTNDFSLSVDGVNGHLDVTDTTDLSFDTTDAFSVTAWVNAPSFSGYQTVLQKIDDSTGAQQGFVLTLNNGVPELWMQSNYSASEYLQVGSTTPLTVNTWHHVAVSYDGSGTAAGVQIFLDGNDTTGSIGSDNLVGSIVNTGEVEIGSRNDGNFQSLLGNIDDVRVYATVLSQSHVSALFGGSCDAGTVAPDTDSDGIPDASDNCPLDANPAQENNENDNEGDVCDSDDDNDGVDDVVDNCPIDHNPAQEDADTDGTGDACDSFTFVPLSFSDSGTDSENGARSGKETKAMFNGLKNAFKKGGLGGLAGGGFGGGGANEDGTTNYSLSDPADLPPGGFGGDDYFDDAQKEVICTAQKMLERNVARLEAVDYLAAIIRDMYNLDSTGEQLVRKELKNAAFCVNENVARLTKDGLITAEAVTIPLDSRGYPVSVNHFWNACVRSDLVTLQRRDNPDRDDPRDGGSMKTCADYIGSSEIYYPDRNVHLKYERDSEGNITKFIAPEGYVLKEAPTLVKKTNTKS